VFEAAEYLGDPRLHEALLRWRELDPDNDLVSSALRTCDREYQRARLQHQIALRMAVERAMAERGVHTAAYVYCDRDDVSVLLGVDASEGRRWIVETILEQAGDDVDVAARRVVSDFEADRG
jgi:hypothetical protein